MKVRDITTEDKKQIEEIFDLYWDDDFRDSLQEKLEGYLQQDTSTLDQEFNFLIAEELGEIVGVSAYRMASEYMKKFSNSVNPAEFYVSAVKKKGRGVGSLLRDARLLEINKAGFTEVLLFSGESHKDAWGFHDLTFKRVTETNAPNGEKGYVWSKKLV